MVAPILMGLALLAGNQIYGRRLAEQRDQALADKFAGLLGAPAQAMGPPDEQGGMGWSGGRGLLADPTNPTNQLAFASGVTQIPGQSRAGLELLNSAFQRAQQGQQFTQQEGRQASQWGQEQARLVDQFGQQQALTREQMGATAEDRQRLANQWAQEFEARRQDAQRQAEQQRQQLAISQGHLDVARQGADAKAGAAPKLPVGYGLVNSASGVVAAPLPGTDDYAKVTAKDQNLADARARIGTMIDMIEGVETTDARTGKKVRKGGIGSELWGDNAAKYSTLRGQIIADVAVLRDMGVLQSGEMERIEDQLPDPSKWTSGLRRNKSMSKSYQELGDQFKVKSAAHRQANPWLDPPPPAGFVR